MGRKIAGIDVAAVVSREFAKVGFKAKASGANSLILIKTVTTPPAASDPTASGTVTRVRYPCGGLVTVDRGEIQPPGSNVKTKLGEVVFFADALDAAGVEPVEGDTVESTNDNGETIVYVVVSISTDPVRATHTCVVR